jgi:hypothetical protein
MLLQDNLTLLVAVRPPLSQELQNTHMWLYSPFCCMSVQQIECSGGAVKLRPDFVHWLTSRSPALEALSSEALESSDSAQKFLVPEQAAYSVVGITTR